MPCDLNRIVKLKPRAIRLVESNDLQVAEVIAKVTMLAITSKIQDPILLWQLVE
jgi:hypothetical protein